MQDDYAHWCAVYKDEKNHIYGVHQKDDGVSYEDLDRSDKLVQFQMLKPDGSVIFSVPFKSGQGNQLIWRRRVQFSAGGEPTTFYLVGKRGAFVACLMPDYSIILDNNFNEENTILADVLPVKGEEGYDG